MAKIIKCSACSGNVSSQANACPHCGQPMFRCPKCGSDQIETISGLKKGASAWAFGIFAANTLTNNYKCKKCGNKFK